MEECELCGQNMETIHIVDVEGVELRVCIKCANGKRIIYKDNPSRKEKNTVIHNPSKPKEFDQSELVSNYGMKIKKARERMRIPTKVLAEMLNEKESFITRVEKEKTVPPDTVIKKLERTLNIKLTEE